MFNWAAHLLKSERKLVGDDLNRLKTENQGSDRLLKQLKNFNSKKEKVHKEQEEVKDRNEKEIERLNVELGKLMFELAKWLAQLADKDILRSQVAKTAECLSTHNGLKIEVDINNSKKMEMQGKQSQLLKDIEDLLADLQELAAEREGWAYWNDGKYMTEKEQKRMEEEGRLKQQADLELALKVLEEESAVLT